MNPQPAVSPTAPRTGAGDTAQLIAPSSSKEPETMTATAAFRDRPKDKQSYARPKSGAQLFSTAPLRGKTMILIGVILAILGFFFSHLLLIIGVILIILGLLGNGWAHFSAQPGNRHYWY